MICLLLSLPFKATEMKQYAFQQIINIQNGLSSSVRCLTVSHEKGYVWVGTRTGIGRFDGYELKKYLHDNITHLFEDNEKQNLAVTAKACITTMNRMIIPASERQRTASTFCRLYLSMDKRSFIWRIRKDL